MKVLFQVHLISSFTDKQFPQPLYPLNLQKPRMHNLRPLQPLHIQKPMLILLEILRLHKPHMSLPILPPRQININRTIPFNRSLIPSLHQRRIQTFHRPTIAVARQPAMPLDHGLHMAEGVQDRVFGGRRERRGLEVSEYDFRIADGLRKRGAPGLERIQQVAIESDMEDSSTAIISDQFTAEGSFERREPAVGLRISAVETLTRNKAGKDL